MYLLSVNSRQSQLFREPITTSNISCNISNGSVLTNELSANLELSVNIENESLLNSILLNIDDLGVIVSQSTSVSGTLDALTNIESNLSQGSNISATLQSTINVISGVSNTSEIGANIIDANFVELLAFPDALGYGKDSIHARSASATVYKVTNLNNSGTGSFRDALTASGPRYVIFEVSGTIQLTTNINIDDPYIYIAGQTAPSPGIFIRDGFVNIRTHDVVIRHVSFHMGDEVSGSNNDSLKLTSLTNGDVDVYNVVVDNCSIKWGYDENLGLFQDHGTRIYAVTLQQCIFAEPLDDDGAKNIQIGTDSGGVPATNDRIQLTLIECFLAHGNQRNPLVKKHCDVDIVNNIIYNWGNSGLDAGDNSGDGFLIHLRRNVYKGGADTTAGGNRGPILLRDTDNTGRIYCDGNEVQYAGQTAEVPSNQENLVVPLGGGLTQNPDAIQTSPVLPSGYITNLKNISSVKVDIPLNVGARPTDRHSEDTRIINEYENGTGVHKNWADLSHPTITENTTTHTVPANPHVDSGNGYHNIEVWLETFLTNVE